MGPALIVASFGLLFSWSNIITIICVIIYIMGFAFAWGIIPWVYPSEIFAMNEKEKAMGLATFFVFAMNFFINMITPSLLEASAGWTFIFFGLLNISNFIFVSLCIKETKGVAPEDVKSLFDRSEDRTEIYPQAREVTMSETHA